MVLITQLSAGLNKNLRHGQFLDCKGKDLGAAEMNNILCCRGTLTQKNMPGLPAASAYSFHSAIRWTSAKRGGPSTCALKLVQI